MKGLRLLFLDKRDDCAKKNEEFYNLSIKKILVTINGMPHQLFAARLWASEIYPELKKYFYKENSCDVGRFFDDKICIMDCDTCSSLDNTVHGSGRAVEKSGILLQIEKAPETSGDLTYYVFSLEDVVAHLSVTDPNGILTIVIEGRIGKFYGVM